MKKFTKGFTLIELLVVIAIIGLLASVVLASLNTARTKAADAATKSNLNNIRAQASLYYDSTGNQSYGSAFGAAACPALAAGTLWVDPSIRAMIVGAQNSSGATAICASTATAYAVSVPLKVTNGLTSWCVDSTGVSKEQSGNITTTNCI